MANIPQYISQFTGEEIDAGILAAQNAISQNNVVQSTGTSTTNVMSQNAVTTILNTNTANIATNTQNIANLQLSAGNSISLSMDSSTYVLSISLLNSQQTILSTATVDLPLEAMVIGASYDDTTQSITLTLQNQQTVTFSVSALVSGLIGDNEVISHQTLPTPTADTPDFIQDTEGLKYKKKDGDSYTYENVGGSGNYVTIDTEQTITADKSTTASISFKDTNNNDLILQHKNNGLQISRKIATTGNTTNILNISGDTTNGCSLFSTLNKLRLYVLNSQSGIYNFNALDFSPAVDNYRNLGTSTTRYKDLYLSGNLSDGTNSISVAEIVNKGTINTQTFNIDSTSWTALSDNTPYTYSTTVTLTQTIGDTNIVELINNQPTIFATYGFAIASISGQVATIYSIGQPTTTINLTVGVS